MQEEQSLPSVFGISCFWDSDVRTGSPVWTSILEMIVHMGFSDGGGKGPIWPFPWPHWG